jgi:hypothetical protein
LHFLGFPDVDCRDPTSLGAWGNDKSPDRQTKNKQDHRKSAAKHCTRQSSGKLPQKRHTFLSLLRNIISSTLDHKIWNGRKDAESIAIYCRHPKIFDWEQENEGANEYRRRVALPNGSLQTTTENECIHGSLGNLTDIWSSAFLFQHKPINFSWPSLGTLRREGSGFGASSIPKGV